MRVLSVAFAAAVVVALGCTGDGTKNDDAPSGPWKLVWSDEFDGAALDTQKWTPDIGSGFGTKQLDHDTGRKENVALDGAGHLVITARREELGGKHFTSGRIKTDGKFSRLYGRFEASMKLPRGQGMWPAFWLLGDDFHDVGWPDCGEIYVMENRGANPKTCQGSAHGPGFSGSGGGALSKRVTLDDGTTFADAFHTFAIEWEPGTIRWYVDDRLYQTRDAEKLSRGSKWVFDHPYFMIVNLAVGGTFGGDPDDTTVFPQELRVDYVRVYAR